MHAFGEVLPFGPGSLRPTPALLDEAGAVVEQRAVDEAGPTVQHVDDLVVEIAEAPTLVGRHRKLAIVALQRVVEVDNTPHERGGEDPDTAEIEQVDGVVRSNSVIA